MLAATHARPRLVLAEHPRGDGADAFWLVGGRIVDWGPLGDEEEVAQRTARALRGGDGTGGVASLTPDEVAESRIVATWVDRHGAQVRELAAGQRPGRSLDSISATRAAARPGTPWTAPPGQVEALPR